MLTQHLAIAANSTWLQVIRGQTIQPGVRVLVDREGREIQWPSPHLLNQPRLYLLGL
ncbi:MAG: hypothetical protein VST67_10755 [Nitrospirota bacterium]|nr:hypothetical protein [Nitrospirota bacterium]